MGIEYCHFDMEMLTQKTFTDYIAHISNTRPALSAPPISELDFKLDIPPCHTLGVVEICTYSQGKLKLQLRAGSIVDLTQVVRSILLETGVDMDEIGIFNTARSWGGIPDENRTVITSPFDTNIFGSDQSKGETLKIKAEKTDNATINVVFGSNLLPSGEVRCDLKRFEEHLNRSVVNIQSQPINNIPTESVYIYEPDPKPLMPDYDSVIVSETPVVKTKSPSKKEGKLDGSVLVGLVALGAGTLFALASVGKKTTQKPIALGNSEVGISDTVDHSGFHNFARRDTISASNTPSGISGGRPDFWGSNSVDDFRRYIYDLEKKGRLGTQLMPDGSTYYYDTNEFKEKNILGRALPFNTTQIGYRSYVVTRGEIKYGTGQEPDWPYIIADSPTINQITRGNISMTDDLLTAAMVYSNAVKDGLKPCSDETRRALMQAALDAGLPSHMLGKFAEVVTESELRSMLDEVLRGYRKKISSRIKEGRGSEFARKLAAAKHARRH